jgi:hypothetical protein
MEWSVGPANTAVWREFGVRLDPQRTGHLLVGQTLILLRPSKDGKSATIEAKEVGEFTSEVDAAPIDAFALSQKQPQIE